MLTVMLVAVGGAAGAVLRYLAVTWIGGLTFPWGTFWVNVAGCLLIGLCGRAAGADVMGMNNQALLMTGVLGGFTTYSAFALDALKLFRNGMPLTALTYVAGTTVACLLAVSCGFWLCGIFFRNLR